MKYISYNNGKPRIIVFEAIQHSDMASYLNLTKDMMLGAGFVTLMKSELICYGESMTLGIVSRDEIDTKLLIESLTP